jgi:hypothetical protein
MNLDYPDNMKVLTVTELDTAITRFPHTNITIRVNDTQIGIYVYGVLIKCADKPTLADNEIIAYIGGWYDCIAVVPNRDGTTDDIKPVLTIGNNIRELDNSVWDIHNCVYCGAYSRSAAVETLIKLHGVSYDIAEQLI